MALTAKQITWTQIVTIATILVSVVAFAVRAEVQIHNNEKTIITLQKLVDENEKDIDRMTERLLEETSDAKLELQRLRGETLVIDNKIDQILRELSAN